MKIDWQKMGGIVPAIIQDALTGRVLMLGYMNQQALSITKKTQQVTFYSRSKQRLWTKGETSNNFLNMVSIESDCDSDALLVQVMPVGNTCHLDQQSCFQNTQPVLTALEETINERKNNPQEGSYTNELFNAGLQRIAQKVGEEGVEVALAGAVGGSEQLTLECADLLYHVLVLLSASGLELKEVLLVLQMRSQ